MCGVDNGETVDEECESLYFRLTGHGDRFESTTARVGRRYHEQHYTKSYSARHHHLQHQPPSHNRPNKHTRRRLHRLESAHPSPQLRINQTSPIRILILWQHRKTRNPIRKLITDPLTRSMPSTRTSPTANPIPIQQPLVILRIALRAIQAAVQIHPPRSIGLRILISRGLVIQDS
jgi:hypothetical protein